MFHSVVLVFWTNLGLFSAGLFHLLCPPHYRFKVRCHSYFSRSISCLSRRVSSHSSLLVSRECTVSTNGLHCSDAQRQCWNTMIGSTNLRLWIALKVDLHTRRDNETRSSFGSLYLRWPKFYHNIRGFCKLDQPTYDSRFMHRSYHYIASRLWNNLPYYVRGAPSLNVFKSMLDEVNLTTWV